jgi:hyaluronate lyase
VTKSTLTRRAVDRPDEQDLAMTGAAMTRRTLLQASGAAALAGVGLSTGAGAAFAAGEGPAELITRRRLMLVGSRSAAGIPELAAQLEYVRWAAAGSWKTMIKTADRTIVVDASHGIGTSSTPGKLALQFTACALAFGYAVLAALSAIGPRRGHRVRAAVPQ